MTDKDLLELVTKAVGEPIGEVRNSEAYFYNGMYTDKTDCLDGTLLYTATQVAAAVAKAKQEYQENLCVIAEAASLRKERIVSLEKINSDLVRVHNQHIVMSARQDERIATLESTLKVALEALNVIDNIALVGSAYTPRSVEVGLSKVEEAIEKCNEVLHD